MLAEGRASEMRTMGEAKAARIRAIGEAQADKAARVGMAEAIAAEEQVRAYGGPRYQVTQSVMKEFAAAIAKAKVDVVPKMVIGGGGQGGSGSMMETLLAMLLSDKLEGPGVLAGEMAKPLDVKSGPTKRPELEAMKKSLVANGTVIAQAAPAKT